MDREIFTPEEERDAHFAAMQWFEAQQMSGRELFTHKELMDGFSWHGHHLRLTHQSQGIWKPQEFKAALTFKTAAITPGKEAPYADRIDDSGLLRYKFSATIKWANDAMKVAAAENYPLAWLVGVKPTKQSTLYYYPRFPAYVVDIDNRNAEFIIAINEMTPPTSDHRDSGQIEKKYVSRWTRARIHQHESTSTNPPARLQGARTQCLPDLLRSLRSSARTALGSLTHHRRLQGSRRP